MWIRNQIKINKLRDISCIRGIEQYVNDNQDKFRTIVKDTRYNNFTTFKFLPGHEAILQSLPEELVRIEDKKEQKKSKKRRHSEAEQQPIEKSDADVGSLEDSNISKKIKENFINRIINFAAKKQFIIEEFGEDNITNFRYENSVFKLSAKCIFCSKVSLCNYKKTYWECGNFTAHLNTHFVDDEINNKTVNPSEPQKLQIVKIITNDDLNDILNMNA